MTLNGKVEDDRGHTKILCMTRWTGFTQFRENFLSSKKHCKRASGQKWQISRKNLQEWNITKVCLLNVVNKEDNLEVPDYIDIVFFVNKIHCTDF